MKTNKVKTPKRWPVIQIVKLCHFETLVEHILKLSFILNQHYIEDKILQLNLSQKTKTKQRDLTILNCWFPKFKARNVLSFLIKIVASQINPSVIPCYVIQIHTQFAIFCISVSLYINFAHINSLKYKIIMI